MLRPLIEQALARVALPDSTFTLPLDHDPPYRTYQATAAHPLSIIGASRDLSPLLASHYINFSCGKGGGAAIVPWRTIGWFVAFGYCEILNTDDKLSFRISDSRNLIQWLIDRLHDGFYLLSHINKYYVPGTIAYREFYFLHDGVIFGYDGNRRLFKVATYLAMGEYGVASVPFDCMALALTQRGNRHFVNVSICHTPVLLAVRPKKASSLLRFDVTAARKNLRDYLHSAPPREGTYIRNDPVYAGDWMQAAGYPIENHSYGLDGFSALINFFTLCVAQSEFVPMTDTRALWEHKRIISRNIRTWVAGINSHTIGPLARQYQEVVEWTHELHWMVFSYNAGDKQVVPELRAHLSKSAKMVAIEQKILGECYRILVIQEINWGKNQGVRAT